MNNETIVYEGKIHKIYYFFPILGILFFGFTILFLWDYFGLMLLIPAFFSLYLLNTILNYLSTKVILTNIKFSYRYGIFSLNQLDIKTEKIESISINKNLIDMIFGSGNIIVSGTGGAGWIIKGLDNPEGLKMAIENLQDVLKK